MRKLFILFVLLFFAGCGAALAGSKYEVEVDITNQTVTVYRGSERTDDAIVRQMICSTGKNNSTPKGTFTVFTRPKTDRQEWYWIGAYSAYVQYVTRFYNDYLFHSLPYARRDLDSIDTTALERMGTAASHGCIRLYSEDAWWMAMNCEDGTKVHIYVSGEPDEELRALLMRQGYAADEWDSYAEYCGYSQREGVVSRASGPEEVVVLQRLLRDYGLYGGELDGDYSFAFMNLIREIQTRLDLPDTGMVDAAFTAALNAETLTPGTLALLSPGSTGPAVKEMQRALATLGYYEGEIDGIYGGEFLESLELYRTVNRLELNDHSDTAFQERLRAEAAALPAGARLVLREVEHDMAQVQEEIVLALRRTPSREAGLMRYVKSEDEVFLLDPVAGHWAHVRVDGTEGYVLSEYLDYYTQTFLEAGYE